jgi:hypothetical protein
VKKKISTGREDVHPQNGLNGSSSTGALVAAGSLEPNDEAHDRVQHKWSIPSVGINQQ